MSLQEKIQAILDRYNVHHVTLAPELENLVMDEVKLAHDPAKFEKVEGVYVASTYVKCIARFMGIKLYKTTVSDGMNIRDRHGKRVGRLTQSNTVMLSSDITYQFKGHTMINVRLV